MDLGHVGRSEGGLRGRQRDDALLLVVLHERDLLLWVAQSTVLLEDGCRMGRNLRHVCRAEAVACRVAMRRVRGCHERRHHRPLPRVRAGVV